MSSRKHGHETYINGYEGEEDLGMRNMGMRPTYISQGGFGPAHMGMRLREVFGMRWV